MSKETLGYPTPPSRTVPRMTDIVDLSAERRNRTDGANQLQPRDALLSALDDLDHGRIRPTHIIVCHYNDEGSGFYQAGKASNVTATGLLHRVIMLIWRHA